mgnify:CR=1 FL=1
MSRLGSESNFREGHKQGRYLFTQANAADDGIDQTLISVAAGFAFRLTGVYYWFRARTVGALTGMQYALGIGALTVWVAELETAAAVYNEGEIGGGGDVGFGEDGGDVVFRWTRAGGLPLPTLRGGIIVWGYEERTT